LSKQNELMIPEQFVEQGADHTVAAGEAGKKAFVEPEITTAVDVLEATTFFQSATSGATN
jgi:hypothetical protein